MKLSIITINLNNKAGLERTILSVIQQSFTDFEYIIIDGGSNDGSVDIIKKYEEKITTWITENDTGIYNAMNKGIFKASGEYCLFLNSGDFFLKSTVLEVMMSDLNEEDIVYGNGFFQAKEDKLNKLECPDKLTLGFFALYSLFHPATIIKKSLFNQYGLYNESYKIVSDWEFFIKTTIIEGVKTKLIPIDVAIAEDNGVSRKFEFQTLLTYEKNMVLDNLLPGYVIDLVIDYKDVKLENKQLLFEKNNLITELNVYKGYLFFRAILKIMRLLTHGIKKLRKY